MHDKTKQPTWWTSTHDSAWDRAKAAVQRDWEQTKVDFGGSGKDLNQDASDTLKHATGGAPVPPLNVANPPSASDVKRHLDASHKADKRAADAATATATATASGNADRERRLDGRARDARSDASDARSDLHEAQNTRWSNVEAAMEYGFGAGMYRVEPWADALSAVRTEWGKIHPDQPWADVSRYVERGWDKARAQ